MVALTHQSTDTSLSNDQRHLIFVSNRGPIEHYFDGTGELRSRRAGGGVAVALASAARNRCLSWIAGACSDADQLAARSIQRLRLGSRGSLKLVPIPEEAREPYYNSFSNPILWFVQHGLSDELASPDLQAEVRESWLSGYLPVNRLFADAVVEEIDRCGGQTRVMLHDYHLYIAPRLIRRARPDALLQQFIHIPWPEPASWTALPDWVIREICRGLLANDSLAFQTEESVTHFLATCECYLGAELTRASETPTSLTYEGRSTHVWANPISVDPSELAHMSGTREVATSRSKLAELPGEKTIVRVDRLDPSKNILRGFQAFEFLLATRPDLRGHVKFLAFLVPSRGGIPEYDTYAERVFALVDSINDRFSSPDWSPITVFHEQNRAQALAGLSLYDVLLVNSVADGMNLVSKEGPLVNEKDGVTCLSTRAGSYGQLRNSVIALDPMEIQKTARALEIALDLRPEVRQTLAAMNRTAIRSHRLEDWLRHQLQDLELVAWRKGGRLATA